MIDITILRVPVFSTLCNAAFALRREVFVLEYGKRFGQSVGEYLKLTGYGADDGSG